MNESCDPAHPIQNNSDLYVAPSNLMAFCTSVLLSLPGLLVVARWRIAAAHGRLYTWNQLPQELWLQLLHLLFYSSVQ